MRAREAARNLCTSEAELLASTCDTSAVRLERRFSPRASRLVEHGLEKASDVTRRLAQSFGVLLEDEGVARATFVLDPDAGL